MPETEGKSSASSPLVLVGGGEHACVVADAARAAGWSIRGYSDVRAGAPVEALGVPFLGDDESVARNHADCLFVLAMGEQALRARVVAALDVHRIRFAAVMHPKAIISTSASVEAGAVVFAGAVVNPGARISHHAIVNTAAVVEHDVEVGQLAHVAPAAAIGGGARVLEGAFVGLGARVRDHVTIGTNAFVAMGAVVVADVPAGETVVGVPARARRKDHEAVA